MMDDPIEISSSSDNDSEMEDIGGNDRLEISSRGLPSWPSSSNATPMPASSSLYALGSNGNSYSTTLRSNDPTNSVFGNRVVASSSKFHSDNSTLGQSQATNSRILNSAGHGYGRPLSQQASRRTLPSWAISSESKVYSKETNGVNDDDLVMLESRSRGLLPSSAMPVKSTATDPIFRPAMVEERLNITDERLIYQAALEDLNQPKIEADMPEGLLSVPLLRHQKIALAWMCQKETRSLHCLGGILADDQGLGKTVSMIALIQMQKLIENKPKAESSNFQKTEALNLDDDEEENGTHNEAGHSHDKVHISEGSTSERSFSGRRPAAGTLVVCPASVLRQWARELYDKVADEAKLSVLVYHGGNRTRDPVELAKYDVVVTTYAIVTSEVPKQPLVDEDEVDEKNEEKYGISAEFSTNKKRKQVYNAGKKGKKGKKGIDSSSLGCFGPLARVGWFRVILDEAQTIKNHRTQVARACCTLRAKRRWCLSGTPIQNAIDDLYSYFRFLKYEPYAAYKSFYHTIKIPISRNSLHGYKKLQAVLRAIMLRRTKGTLIDGEPIIMLPPKIVNLKKVDFSLQERDFYVQLETASRSQFKAYAAAGTVKQNYASILLMLLRLRQACDHPLLVKADSSDSVGKVSGEMAKKLPRDTLKNLLEILEATAVCQECNDTPEDPVITMCGHVFCYQCVSEYLSGDDNMCPESKCKEQLGPDFVYTKATLRSCISCTSGNASTSSQPAVKTWIMDSEYTSSKISAALQILQDYCLAPAASPGFQIPEEGHFTENTVKESCGSNPNVVKYTTVFSSVPTNGPAKAIIFSQWTGMLNLVEISLNQFCIPFRRLDGTMSLAARDRAVKDFNTDPEVTVMLMSLKAGNLGLNMVAACHVILLDLWWNPTTEDQAVDRAHRIGQTRPVTVTRITIKDTVEDRILSLQEEKRKMVASAFGEDHGGSSGTRLTVDDLKYLFML